MRLRFHLRPILLLTACVALRAAEPGAESRFAGLFWSPEKDAKIQFYRCGEAICGRIVWLEHPGKDINNPDPSRRGRDLLGLEIFSGFTPKGADIWAGGTVYDPDSGDSYRGKMWFGPDHRGQLYMRGYIGLSFFGRTEVLEPVAGTAVSPPGER